MNYLIHEWFCLDPGQQLSEAFQMKLLTYIHKRIFRACNVTVTFKQTRVLSLDHTYCILEVLES